MLICSCAVISDHDIELALLEIMVQQDPPLPTPGVVWRHLSKKMNCCGCAPLAVETIYAKLDDLMAKGLVCPYACTSIKHRLRAQVRNVRGPSRIQAFADELAGS